MVCPVFLTRRAIHTATLYNETIRMYFLLLYFLDPCEDDIEDDPAPFVIMPPVAMDRKV